MGGVKVRVTTKSQTIEKISRWVTLGKNRGNSRRTEAKGQLGGGSANIIIDENTEQRSKESLVHLLSSIRIRMGEGERTFRVRWRHSPGKQLNDYVPTDQAAR